MIDHGTLALGVVVLARALLPLGLFRLPLPTILACLVLDAVDHGLLHAFGAEPSHYEAYDKAMDTYYLALAYLSMLRNWDDVAAFRIGRFLFLVRLVGAAAFEISGWAPVLLVLPNTFEYFFIAHELVRSRWRTARVRARTWVALAAAIWILVKLPQEWWIHVAHLDATAFITAHPLLGWPPVVLLVVAAALAVPLGRRYLPLPEHGWRFDAGPLPDDLGSPEEREAWRADHGRLLSGTTAEKVALPTLLVVVYGHVVAGPGTSELALLLGTLVVAAAQAVLTLTAARRWWTPASGLLLFLARAALNTVLVAALDLLAVPAGSAIGPGDAFVLLTLVTVVSALHDRYVPVHVYRARHRREHAPSPGVDREPQGY